MEAGDAADSAVAVCPISLEPVRTPVVLRGATFDAASLVAMAVAANPPLHPYARTPLTPEELGTVREAALRDPEALRMLGEVALRSPEAIRMLSAGGAERTGPRGGNAWQPDDAACGGLHVAIVVVGSLFILGFLIALSQMGAQ